MHKKGTSSIQTLLTGLPRYSRRFKTTRTVNGEYNDDTWGSKTQSNLRPSPAASPEVLDRIGRVAKEIVDKTAKRHGGWKPTQTLRGEEKSLAGDIQKAQRASPPQKPTIVHAPSIEKAQHFGAGEDVVEEEELLVTYAPGTFVETRRYVVL